jgi:hypothetical protein
MKDKTDSVWPEIRALRMWHTESNRRQRSAARKRRIKICVVASVLTWLFILCEFGEQLGERWLAARVLSNVSMVIFGMLIFLVCALFCLAFLSLLCRYFFKVEFSWPWLERRLARVLAWWEET